MREEDPDDESDVDESEDGVMAVMYMTLMWQEEEGTSRLPARSVFFSAISQATPSLCLLCDCNTDGMAFWNNNKLIHYVCSIDYW